MARPRARSERALGRMSAARPGRLRDRIVIWADEEIRGGQLPRTPEPCSKRSFLVVNCPDAMSRPSLGQATGRPDGSPPPCLIKTPSPLQAPARRSGLPSRPLSHPSGCRSYFRKGRGSSAVPAAKPDPDEVRRSSVSDLPVHAPASPSSCGISTGVRSPAGASLKPAPGAPSETVCHRVGRSLRVASSNSTRRRRRSRMVSGTPTPLGRSSVT